MIGGFKFILYLVKNVVDAIIKTFDDCGLDIDDMDGEMEYIEDEETEETQ